MSVVPVDHANALFSTANDGRAHALALIGAASTPTEVLDLMSRVEAAKAWARVHRQVKQWRLDLLRLEVAALVKMVELGGVDMLPEKDRRAAKWLAEMSPAQRDTLLSESGSATTAAGMCRSIWAAAEQESYDRSQRENGWRQASDPKPAPKSEPELHERVIADATDILRAILAEHVSVGEPFTIESLAESLVNQYQDVDEAYMEGVREMCRTAIRTAPEVEIDGTVIPRFVTARTPDGFLRVPTESARLSHLESALALCEEQVRESIAKLKRFRIFVDKVRALSGGTDIKVGDVIAASLTNSTAA